MTEVCAALDRMLETMGACPAILVGGMATAVDLLAGTMADSMGG